MYGKQNRRRGLRKKNPDEKQTHTKIAGKLNKTRTKNIGTSTRPEEG
jgi:hypothetical protein